MYLYCEDFIKAGVWERRHCCTSCHHEFEEGVADYLYGPVPGKHIAAVCHSLKLYLEVMTLEDWITVLQYVSGMGNIPAVVSAAQSLL